MKVLVLGRREPVIKISDAVVSNSWLQSARKALRTSVRATSPLATTPPDKTLSSYKYMDTLQVIFDLQRSPGASGETWDIERPTTVWGSRGYQIFKGPESGRT